MTTHETVRMNHDPVAAEIHRKALDNVVNEMALTLIRTSGSPVVTEAMDFSTCLLDREGEPLSLASYVLLHAAASMIGTKTLIAQLKESGETPKSGDGWLVNDPFYGGALHQADFGIITPAFYHGELVGWSYVNCHVLDVGGVGVSGFAPGARSVYEEGLRMPLLQVIVDGQLDKQWERFIRTNVRVPDLVINDIRSMIASNNVAQSKMVDVIDRFGLEGHHNYCRINQDLTERLMRERISGLPDGTFESCDWSEYDGQGSRELHEVSCKLQIIGDELKFSFKAVPQVAGPINASIGGAYGQIISVIMTTLGYGDLPYNAGIWKPITIDLGPPGTIANAAVPAPVSFSHGGTAIRIGKLAKDVLNQAIALSESQALRERLAGAPNDGPSMTGLFGTNQEGNACVMFYTEPCVAGGGGARIASDGMDFYGLTCMAAGGITDVEVHEASDPVLFLWRKLAPNTGGPGQWRGGQGADMAYEVRYTDKLSGYLVSQIAELPHRGVGGGLPGSTSSTVHMGATNLNETIESGRQPVANNISGSIFETKSYDGSFVVQRGEVVNYIVGGGGGLGDPLLRSMELVAADVRDQYITKAHAEAIYGVKFGSDGDVDQEATKAERLGRRKDRIGAKPERSLTSPSSPGVTVTLTRAAAQNVWTCGYCAAELCSAHDNWRSSASVVRRENDAANVYHEMGMSLRSRDGETPITFREFYCKTCAGALAMEVAPQGYEFPVPDLSELT